MPRLCALCGIPGSGKTTAAARILSEIEAEAYSSDDIYAGCTAATFDEIRDQHHAAIKRDLLAGRSVVCDGTYATEFVRRCLLQALEGIDCERVLVVMTTPLEECLRRNATRTGRARVQGHVLRRFAEIYEPPTLAEGWTKIIYYPEGGDGSADD